MKKPQIQKIIPHIVHRDDSGALSDRIADLHIQVIERYLRQTDLTTEQKVRVIDLIEKNMSASPT